MTISCEPAESRRSRAALLERPRARGVLAALTVLFNVLLLNFLIVVASALLVTIPLATRAGSAALERWRADGEDRVAREFWRALRRGRPLRSLLVVGGPQALLVVAVVELRYFAHEHGLAGHVCLGLSFSALTLSVVAIGYVLDLERKAPDARATDIWTAALHLGIANLWPAALLLVAEIALGTILAVADPTTLLLGTPLALLASMRWAVARTSAKASA